MIQICVAMIHFLSHDCSTEAEKHSKWHIFQSPLRSSQVIQSISTISFVLSQFDITSARPVQFFVPTIPQVPINVGASESDQKRKG